ARVSRREALALGHRGEDLLLRLFLEAGSDRREDKDAGITSVPEVCGGRVRNPAGLVVAREVAAEIQLAVHDSDHGKPDARDLDRFAGGGAAAEELFAQAAAQEDQP